MNVTPTQTLILWSLLARHGHAPQGDLVPAVKKADREALAALGLVALEKRGRSFMLTVTDRGWHWASDHLDAPLPPAFRTLQDWLARTGQHLARTGGTLADLIGPAPEPAPVEAAPRPPAKRTPRKPASPPSTRPAPAPGPHRGGLPDPDRRRPGAGRAPQPVAGRTRRHRPRDP